KAAFDAEVALWQEEAALDELHGRERSTVLSEEELAGGELVSADISGNVWKLLVQPGHEVRAGDPLLVIEAMKMEFAVHAPSDGVIHTVHCEEGRLIQAGDPLVVITERAAA